MTENVENLVLEHLKRFQAVMETMAHDLREVKTRQSEMHAAILGLRRDQVNDAEASAHLQTQFDWLRDRLDRIERRLELTN
ncbi:MAG: hypothetical protein ACTHK5_00500 [Tsuneonella sp.]|jgi:hypothetical protein